MHVVATAGHVDHGKSTLVRALTGMEPDRWAEERRRGLTIDLGFAWTTLERSGPVSFVDVPGHERFVANMLAGVGPAPAVLFTVAADGGWSAQSTEHLAAIDALGVEHGLLVVTRSDLADPEPVLAHARTRLAGTSLAGVDAVAVSATTGAGITELRAALDAMLAALPPARADARVRLWVDRSFTVRGAGTVVTGTLTAGTIAGGDTLALIGGRRVQVRGLQTNDAARDRAGPVSRVALNLRGVGADEIGRGDVLLTPDAWHVTDVFDARADTDAPLPRELMLHVGTAAMAVQVRALGGGFLRLQLPHVLALAPTERAVLRDPGRQLIAAGIEVLDVDPPALARRGAAKARADYLATTTLDAEAHVLARRVVTRAELARRGVGPNETASARIRAIGDLLVAEPVWQEWVRRLPAAVAGWAQRDPLQPHPTPGAVRDEIGMPHDPALFAAVAAAAHVNVVDGRATLGGDAGRGPRLPGVERLIRRLDRAPFDAPTREQLDELGLGRRELAAAAKANLLLVLPGDIVLLPDSPTRAAAALAVLEAPFTTSAARQVLETTRRVMVPLLEHLDAVGITERLDATTRRLRPS